MVLGINLLLADSPLTSTEFGKAYAKAAIVQRAAQTNGVLTEDLAAFLLNKKQPVALKMAVINTLSWNIEGKGNAKIFAEYLSAKNKGQGKTDFIASLDWQELICLAYLQAMDNYSDVTEADQYAKMAKQKTNSYTVHLISALIESQMAMQGDWCQVYQITDAVRRNKTLAKDLKPKASRMVFDYMVLYKADCK
jgi:hypothetical protein